MTDFESKYLDELSHQIKEIRQDVEGLKRTVYVGSGAIIVIVGLINLAIKFL